MIAEILSGDLIPVRREALQVLFDSLVSGMDFGSGFLDSPEVEALREVAVVLGVDPNVATPSEHRRNYPHPYSMMSWAPLQCRDCLMAPEHPSHQVTDA